MLLKGIAAAPGIAVGRAVVKTTERIRYRPRSIEPEKVADEVQRFRQSIEAARSELEAIKTKIYREYGEKKAEIFDAHQTLLQDPEFVGAVQSKIENEKVSAETALEDATDRLVALFESMDNEYLRARAADLRDVSQRVMKILTGVCEQAPADVDEPVILVADDLSPSDTAQLDREKIKGIATDIGSRTSHSAIMARTMEIPAVVGLSAASHLVKTGDMVIVDGFRGEVIVRPEPELLEAYQEKQRSYQKQKEVWAALVHEPSITADGYKVKLVANIGNMQDAVKAIQHGAEGIGLFRTEFLYMDREDLPGEEEQFEVYKSIAGIVGKERPVVIRTLDIGGDKELSYLSLPKEANPFLGYRAIRLCLDRKDIFKAQLRALLRASAFGNIKIMYPMIATLRELRQANQVLEEAKRELCQNGIPFNNDVEVGIMIEVPAAAMIADQLAKEADFFSIGTNDLIQYTMAADRMNERVSYLYDPYHPAVLRLIRQVIQAAHQEGKWVGMCGEMAGEELAIPILLGLGLDEFSMSASSILRARHLIKQLEYGRLAQIANHALTLESSDQIKAYIEKEVLHLCN